MTPRRRRRSWALLAVLLALATTTTACVGMPDTGPVVPADVPARSDPQVSVERRAQPPQEGESSQNIVQGFLQAMQAYPVDLRTSRKFLTSEEQDSWNPSRRIITYGSSNQKGTPNSIEVRLDDTDWVDSRGVWRGRLGDGRRRLTLPLTKENGEWRISAAPNAFLVPDDWFRDYYQPASVYYFDPTASILAPEPVFVPGDQLAPALVQALLRGPGPRLTDVARTFLPAGVTPTFTVSAGGKLAHLTLDGDVARPTTDEATLMLAQLAWTLKQTSVVQFTVTIGGDPLSAGASSTTFDIDDFATYDPVDQQATPLLYAVRNGSLEVGDATAFQPVDGPFGTTGTIIDVAVSLTATYAAAVVDDRTAVVRGSVNDDQHPLVTVASGATRLLRPGWDSADRLWLVDRTSEGAVVSYVAAAEGALPVAVPVRGISGRYVKRFIISRDGTRLVAVVRGRDRDVLRVSRITHDSAGNVLGATPSQALPWSSGDTQRISDIGWQSPTLVGVLHLVTTQFPQIVSVSVDGSGSRSTVAQAERAQELVASPVPRSDLFTFTPERLFGLNSEPVDLPPGFSSIQYVG
jgi:hypothetical protein